MVNNFRSWFNLEEGLAGYVAANILEVIVEGRRDPTALQNRRRSNQQSLFAEPEPEIEKPRPKQVLDAHACPVTPLSGYRKHIEAIQSYARKSPENFAQVLIFSPLSANVPFSKHWNNFHVLMLILKHYFPKKVERQQLELVVDAFNDYLHSLAHTIQSFKLDTITDVWNQREQLMQELSAIAKEGDDVKLISKLSEIKGVQPVKAGFIAQLLFGRAGCIDTHNIDIYSKVYPDIANKFNAGDWQNNKQGGVEKYVSLLGDLEKRGIGTQQLWDVWVDFVENMYKMISSHGRGSYADMGSALDPNDPVYQALKNVEIPKIGLGKKKDVFVPLVSGKHGMGASATHLPMDPDDALNQFYNMYRMGQKGSDAASSVPFHTDAMGRPMDATSGMGLEPSSLHYFGKALTNTGVDPDHVRDIIRRRLAKGGRKAQNIRANQAQSTLGFDG
jgi:hypothetical protein